MEGAVAMILGPEKMLRNIRKRYIPGKILTQIQPQRVDGMVTGRAERQGRGAVDNHQQLRHQRLGKVGSQGGNPLVIGCACPLQPLQQRHNTRALRRSVIRTAHRLLIEQLQALAHQREHFGIRVKIVDV